MPPTPAPSLALSPAPPPDPRAEASFWRAAHRLIDLHTHIDPTPDHMALAVRVFDTVFDV